MRRARIIGTGMVVPPTAVTNEQLSQKLGKPLLPMLEEQNGIYCRRITGDAISSGDLAVMAGQQALENAGIEPDEIDLIIIATDTPEYMIPPTSVVVQGRLAAHHAGTLDINGACSGFVAALNVAARMMGCGEDYGTVLVIGTYNMTKFADPEDNIVAPLFSDGAGAVVLQADNTGRGFLAGELFAQGEYHDYFGVFAGGTKEPPAIAGDEVHRPSVEIRKQYPVNINREYWPPLIHRTLNRAGLEARQLDHAIFTQVNRANIEWIMAELGLPLEKTTCIMGDYGYTGSACIPMALHQAVSQGKLKPGDLVMFVGSGVGVAIALAVFRW